MLPLFSFLGVAAGDHSGGSAEEYFYSCAVFQWRTFGVFVLCLIIIPGNHDRYCVSKQIGLFFNSVFYHDK